MTINLSALQKQRWDTAANWTAENPTLLAGEIGIESDTGYWKVGNGSTAWTSLAYVSGLGAEIPVSRLADGTAGQIIQTDTAGTGVEWSSTANLPLGSASAPAYRFQGDTNTGIYSPGADQLALSTSGVGRVFVDASGRVGIGTSTPGDYSGVSTQLSIAATGNSGLNIVSGTSSAGIIRFADGTVGDAAYRGRVEYLHDVDALTFGTAANERLRITSAGLVGIGVSTFSTQAKAEIATSGTGERFYIQGNTNSSNAYLYIDAPANRRKALVFRSGGSDRACIGVGDSDELTESTLFLSANANSGGTSPHMVINSSGNVGIGTTSPSAALSCYHATNNTIATFQSGDSVARATFIDPSGQAHVGAEGDNLVFAVTSSATERARIDSSGRLLVGTSSSSTADTLVLANNSSSANDAAVLRMRRAGTIATGNNVGVISFENIDGLRIGASIQCENDQAANWATGDSPGRLVFSTTADGASSPTERMRIDSGGAVLIGKTSAGIGNSGIELSSAGQDAKFTTFGATPVFVNRLSTDGVLIDLQQASTTEGTISVSGTTVSYNGAHLSRWSQLVGIDPYDKTARPEILRGTVMSNLDEMCDWTCPISGDCQDNEQLNKTEISSVDGDPNVAGVFQSWDDDDDTWVNDFYLAMTGDFVIRIAAGTTVQRGDLLMSAGDGTAKPQDDDIIRSKTIAKVTSTNVSCTHPDGSYCVPCVLMAC